MLNNEHLCSIIEHFITKYIYFKLVIKCLKYLEGIVVKNEGLECYKSCMNAIRCFWFSVIQYQLLYK